MVVGERRISFGNASFARSVNQILFKAVQYQWSRLLNESQRESSATIKAAPIPYQQASPPTRQKILEIDCRGLEFTEFHSEVCNVVSVYNNLKLGLMLRREIG